MRSGTTAGFGRGGVEVAKSWILYVYLFICFFTLFFSLDDSRCLGGLEIDLYPLSFRKV